jgi:hypothetical protein
MRRQTHHRAAAVLALHWIDQLPIEAQPEVAMKREWRGDQVRLCVAGMPIPVESAEVEDAAADADRAVERVASTVDRVEPIVESLIGGIYGVSLASADVEAICAAAERAAAALRALKSAMLRADPLSGRRGRVRGFQRSRSLARQRWE